MFKKDIDCGFAVQGTSGGALYQFQSGNLQGRWLSEIDYQELLQSQKNIPVVVLRGGRNTWWMFKGDFYCEDEGYTVEQVKEGYREEKLKLSELERLGEKFDEKLDTDFLNTLPMNDVKLIVSIRNQIVENLYIDAKKEYDDWVLKGKSAVEQAARELLKPGEDIKRVEEFIGKIPDDFIGGGSFKSSHIYKKWSIRIKDAEKRLENAKKFLGAKVREKFALPDIPVEEGESIVINSGREPIPDHVKMYVWQRDSGKCVKCESQERLEYDHIIPISKGGVTQHAIFSFSAKPAIALKEVL